jgi:acyl carrier protein
MNTIEFVSLIKKTSDIDVELNQTLRDSGVDSLDMVEILLEIEDSHNIYISESEVTGDMTFQQLFDLAISKLS